MNTSQVYRGDWYNRYPPGRYIILLAALVAFCTLQACVSMSPDQLSQRLYKADRSITQAMLLSADLHTKGLIPEQDWPRVKEGLDDASAKIDQAWAAFDSDPEQAANDISTAEGLLEAIKMFMPALGQAIDKKQAEPVPMP